MNAFREPALVFEEKLLPAFRRTCPACGAGGRHCPKCGASTPNQTDLRCWKHDCNGVIIETPLTTSSCVPESRYRLGWFRRCREERAHVHQRCVVCDWRGIVMQFTDGSEGGDT